MAAAGYVVLYTNPRGSISYGEEFGNLIHHAYPGDDFHDLNSAVDHVVGMGFVDEERLYVTGGSGGGVLTAWMIGNTDRFRAAVAFYPVINWESFIFTADLSGLFLDYWVPGPALAPPGQLRGALAAARVGKREDADAHHDRGGGLAHADVRVRAVLQGAQAAGRGDRARAGPGGGPRHHRAAEPCDVEDDDAARVVREARTGSGGVNGMDRRCHRFAVAAGMAGLLLCTGIARADSLALTGGTVIDGTGTPPIVDATVLVEDGRIAAVGLDVAVPANARTIDVRGST